MTRSRPAADRHYLGWTLLWFSPLLLAWGGLSVLSHTPTLWAIAWTQRCDTHWNPAGHALVAVRLALELHQRDWLTTPLPDR